MDHLEKEQLLEAEAQVEAFLIVLSRRYGVDPDEIPKFVEALRWAAEHRGNIKRLSWHAFLGVVSAVVFGGIALFVLGIKTWVQQQFNGTPNP